MTCITFCSSGPRLTGFTVRGHSGYAPAGGDIVCAAVSSAVRLTEAAVNGVLGLGAPVKVRPADAFVSLRLPEGLGPEAEHTCQALLSGMMVHCLQLQEEYPAYISVLEKECAP